MTPLIEFVETISQANVFEGKSITSVSRIADRLSVSSFFTGRNYPSKRLLDTTGVWKFSENRRSNSVNGRKGGTEKAPSDGARERGGG